MSSARIAWPGCCLALALFVGCSASGGDDDDDDSSSPVSLDELPAAEISGPADGAVVAKGTQVRLAGQVSDVETAPESLQVSWSSDLDGKLGSSSPTAAGAVVLDVQLSATGTHVIALDVTDGQGQSSRATIQIVVDSAPTARITAVDPSRPQEGEEVTFTGVVADGEDDPRNLRVRWEDDRGDLLGESPADKNGNVELTTDELQDGKRTITLSVEDSAGLTATATFKVTVTACLDEDNDDATDCDGDCDDEDPDVYPGAEELCDGLDQDCNGEVDDGFPDGDGDGVPSCRDNCPDKSNSSQADRDSDGVGDSCDNCPDASNPNQEDGNGDGKGDACVPEICNGQDDNGNGQIDEGFDQDRDGSTTCNGDCNDNDPAARPGATEVCDAVDNDCDGQVNEGFTDQWEPNETLNTAYDFGDRNGVDEVATHSFEGTLHGPADADFYKFFLVDDFAIGQDQFFLKVTLFNIPSGSNYDLYVWWDEPEDSSAMPYVVQQSISTGNADEAVYVKGESGPDSGGFFWIEVRYVSGTSCTQPYSIIYENKG